MSALVECAAKGCERKIPVARAAIAVTRGMCEPCNKWNLTAARREREPEYETEVWARGGRL